MCHRTQAEWVLGHLLGKLETGHRNWLAGLQLPNPFFVFRVRSLTGALMQGGISVNPLARVAANFSALYLIIFLILAALNMWGHAIPLRRLE